MRDVIKEKVETITTKIKKPKSKDNPNDSGRNTENELTEEQEMALKMDMQFKRDSLVQELLEKSNEYMEKNMNAAANNLSLLTLHSFELGYHIEKQCKDQVMQEKIIRNISAHTNFTMEKSESMRDRLSEFTRRFESDDNLRYLDDVDARIKAARNMSYRNQTRD